uniref:adenylate cyclase n=1 Tax=Schlesneria paludicola TaxID=360056 RepID=A0A7C2JZM3_9PLAN
MARVLIADDNPIDRKMLAADLEQLGHEVCYAADGQEALAQLRREPFDLVVLDMHMPVMDGAETFEQMQKNPQWRQIPVLILSAGEGRDVVDFIARGAEDYLVKSSDPSVRALLKARVTNCLQKKHLRDSRDRDLQRLKHEQQNVIWLLNALFPYDVVQQLLPALRDRQETQRISIEPQRYHSAAVMFCDIVDFTAFCEAQDPRMVVGHLQELVSAFERIVDECGLEKIKTIGDSFLATAGLRTFMENPVGAAVECAWRLQAAARERPPHWTLRVGIDFGPVVAGIVGSRKFQYDIWGRTVNMAARVESEGLNGRVNLSESAWNQVAELYEAEIVSRVLKGVGPQTIYALVNQTGTR